MKTLTVKRGDTFGFSVALSNILSAESVEAITGKATSLACQIRDRASNLISAVVITESDTAGTYIFRAGDTTSWPSFVLFDVQYTDDEGRTVSSDTLGLSIVEGVTQ